jgi:hypothetical protein
MSELFSIISALKVHPSTINKQQILEANKDNEVLKAAFSMTENPFYNYYIKVDKAIWEDVPGGEEEITFELLNSVFDQLAGRKVTGHAARDYLAGVLTSLTKKDRAILRRIINRDLECNVGTAICNKVWPGLIPEMPCMLASKMDEKAAASVVPNKYGYIVQTKMDGGRAMATVNFDGSVNIRSRNGKELLLYGFFDTVLSKFPGYVFDGELVVMTDNGVEDRKTGNGFFTKAVRGTINQKEASRFRYVVWDMIPLADFNAGKSTVPYKERLSKLIDAQSLMTPGIVHLVQSRIVSTLQEAEVFYSEMLERGEEGAILKFADMPWEDRRSKKMIKLKEEKDIDAEVIGVTEHTKVPGWVGSLTCKTADGLVQFDVGSGFTEVDRQKPFDYYFGKIVKCKYNALISNKTSTIKSLFLPIFVEVRDDKLTANSLKDLK